MFGHMHLPIVALMDCITFLKHSIPDYELGPGIFMFRLSMPLVMFLLFGLGVKFLCCGRFVIRSLSKNGFGSRKEHSNPGPNFESSDVSKLRESIEAERRRSNVLLAELAREREASASAAEEAMAMILRVQNEKSSIELESRQYKRLAEERQMHDHEVIRSLQWLVRRHESEEGVRPCDGNILEDFESVLYSSRDVDSLYE